MLGYFDQGDFKAHQGVTKKDQETDITYWDNTNGEQILVSRMNKNKKFQKEQLMKEGYNDFKEFYKNPLK